MTDKVITRLLPDGALDGGMKPMGYISADTVADGIADERGHLFFTNAAGNVNAGVWQCTPCTERIRHYPYDQCCFVVEGSRTITDESGHVETFNPGYSSIIPRGFNGLWQMTDVPIRLTDISQITSKSVEIVPPSHRQRNCIPFVDIRGHEFGYRPSFGLPCA